MAGLPPKVCPLVLLLLTVEPALKGQREMTNLEITLGFAHQLSLLGHGFLQSDDSIKELPA